jgi:phosphotransferase family enzyme
MPVHAFHSVPVDLLAELRKYPAGQHINDEVLDALGLRPLSGGRNNVVYRWESPQGPACIKVYRVDERRRIHREWQALTLLARHAITQVPTPLWIDLSPEQPALAMSLLPGVPVPELDHSEDALRGVVATMIDLSNLPLSGELADLERIDAAGHYIIRITRIWAGQLTEHPSDALTRDLIGLLDRWAASQDVEILAEPAARIFSRGDSNLVNWLWDGTQVRCVDFEFSGYSDLPFECADLIEHISARDVADSTWEQLISAFPLDSDHDTQRFAAAQRTCALRWLAVLWKQRENRSEEFATQLDRVRRLHAPLSSR